MWAVGSAWLWISRAAGAHWAWYEHHWPEGAATRGRLISFVRLPGAGSNFELSSRYLPRPGSTPVPCQSQIPRLCRHQPPPRMHCCASVSIGLVGAEAGIVEAHPARNHTVTAIPIAARTILHLHYAAEAYRAASRRAPEGGAERQARGGSSPLRPARTSCSGRLTSLIGGDVDRRLQIERVRER